MTSNDEVIKAPLKKPDKSIRDLLRIVDAHFLKVQTNITVSKVQGLLCPPFGFLWTSGSGWPLLLVQSRWPVNCLCFLLQHITTRMSLRFNSNHQYNFKNKKKNEALKGFRRPYNPRGDTAVEGGLVWPLVTIPIPGASFQPQDDGGTTVYSQTMDL